MNTLIATTALTTLISSIQPIGLIDSLNQQENSMYYTYFAVRQMPLNQDGIKVVEHAGQAESETGDLLIVSNKTAVVTRVDSHGWVVTCVNAEEQDVGFAVDFNARAFDVQKSWRIKITYPEVSYQDLISQSDGTTERGWNFFSFRNEVLFDSLSPTTIVSTSPNQKVLIWKLPEDVECLSTPWVQHSVATNVRAKSIGEFSCHFYASADINIDGKVDAVDLALLNNGMGTPSGDVDGDGTTTAKDLSELLAQWSTAIAEDN